MENEKISTRDRELIISRKLNAPVALVWEVWTRPEHIVNWWGPDGFTNTINSMEVSPGGEWDLVMHGPDGTDYKNRSIFKEVIPLKKIVYEMVSAAGGKLNNLNTETVQILGRNYNEPEQSNKGISIHTPVIQNNQNPQVIEVEETLSLQDKEMARSLQSLLIYDWCWPEKIQ